MYQLISDQGGGLQGRNRKDTVNAIIGQWLYDSAGYIPQ
jgi:hypothetical protein